MPPRTHALLGLLAVVLAAALTGCGSPAATFDPSGSCGIDGTRAGAYPDLEALLPKSLGGAPPGTVNSGRDCSDAALGSLIVHDARGIRFAGAIWDLGNGTAVTSVVFNLPGRDLSAAWIAEFYNVGAQTAKRTENIATSAPSFPGAGTTARLDTLNDLSLQTIVSWQDGANVRAVLVATAVLPGASRATHDDLVAKAVAATVAAQGGT